MMSPEKLLRELIALPSVNPAFMPAQTEWIGEHRVSDFLAHWADRLGLEIEFQKVLPNRANLLARLVPSGRKVKQRILLAPHMDTVGVVNGSKFKPVLRGDRLFGRGACDTKGSVTAMFSALLDFAANGTRPVETEIVFLALVDEENAQAGSRKFAASRKKADLAIVGEPTRNRLVTAHKGDFWLRLTTSGKAAHGAAPHQGRNAVHEMAKAVDLIETKYAKALKRKRHKLLGNPTVNVGVMRGGRQPNIVPDQCEVLIDRRTLPGETEKIVRGELNELFNARGLKVVITNAKETVLDALETDPDMPLLTKLLRSLRQKEPFGVDFFCDAAPLAAGGIPSVVFGPGDIAQAHTEDEWISVKSLNRATEQLKKFLRSLP
jgi:succinyl-diaminopimelate desuccinylase